MSDLVAFVHACLEEDETAARAALAGPGSPAGGIWTAYEHPPDSLSRRSDRPLQLVGCTEPDGREWAVADAGQWDRAESIAVHIARHDPARVLRGVEAGRKILDHHAPVRHEGRTVCASCLGSSTFWPCPTLSHMAAVWSDHPDYREEWAPS